MNNKEEIIKSCNKLLNTMSARQLQEVYTYLYQEAVKGRNFESIKDDLPPYGKMQF